MHIIGRAALLVLAVSGVCGQTPGFWRIQTVASEPWTGWGSLAFWPDGRPALTYANGQPWTGPTKYGEWDGAAWQITTIANKLSDNSLAILDQRPMVAYQAPCGGSVAPALWLAQRDGATWSITELEICSSDVSRTSCSLLPQPDTGFPAIAQGLQEGHSPGVEYTWFDGGRWQTEKTSSHWVIVELCKLNFLPNGHAAIAFTGRWQDPHNLMHYFSDFSWTERASPGNWTLHRLETADTDYVFSGLGSAVIDGELAICEVSYGHLWYWFPKTDLGPADYQASMAVLRDGQPGIAYYYAGALRFMWRTRDGWRNMEVDPETSTNSLVTLAIRPGTGQPAILYYTDGLVYFALAFFRGDLNCDGALDFDDINPFVLALSDPAGYAAAYPDCKPVNGDLNEDGVVNFDDVNPFVALLAQQPGR